MDSQSIRLNEPIKIKDSILSFDTEFSKENINWTSTAIWMGNRLQTYLWESWRNDLSPMGFTWPKFLKFMKFQTGDAILWLYNRITWQEFISNVRQEIEGPLGLAIVATKKHEY